MPPLYPSPGALEFSFRSFGLFNRLWFVHLWCFFCLQDNVLFQVQCEQAELRDAERRRQEEEHNKKTRELHKQRLKEIEAAKAAAAKEKVWCSSMLASRFLQPW